MADELTYKYLSDGTKLSVKKSDGSSIIYRGNFVYDVSADGIVTLESVGILEGRVYCIDTPDGELWECWDVKDYLGNVRAVVRSNNGSTIKINDYLPYGTKIEEYSTSYQVGHNRWHYAGKEYQDFGSRYYSPGLGRWTATDPQSWKYSSASPYNYCNNNPVNFVDPNGEAVYYSYSGDFITSDDIDDGRIFLVADNYLNINTYSAVMVRNAFPEGFEEVGGLIIQYRFEETSNYTVSTFETVGGDVTVTGVILEPEGPDTTTPNMNKRIPAGVYHIDNYHSAKYPDHYILFNEDVPKSRKILYHSGANRGHTEGCQLTGATYKNGTLSGGRNKFKELQGFIESVGAKNVRTIISNKRLK